MNKTGECVAFLMLKIRETGFLFRICAKGKLIVCVSMPQTFISADGAPGSCCCLVTSLEQGELVWLGQAGIVPCPPHPSSCLRAVQGLPQAGWFWTLLQ